jgi:hypothetical protein
MTYTEIPYAELGKLSDDLTRIGEQVAEAERLRPIEGLDHDHAALSQVLEAFHASRRRALQQLAGQIQQEGSLVRDIAVYVQQVDSAMSEQMRKTSDDSE